MMRNNHYEGKLANLLKLANTSKQINWRRTVLTAPIILTLLAGCIKRNDESTQTAAIATATSTSTAEVVPTATPTLLPTSTPTRQEPTKPVSTHTVIATQSADATETATATSGYNEQIDNSVEEINNFLDSNGRYSASELEEVLFSFARRNNSNKLGRFNDLSLPDSIMYPVNLQVILLGVVSEPHDILVFFGTEDAQGKRFVFPAKWSRDYETTASPVVTHIHSFTYSESATETDMYELNSDANIDRFVAENLGKPLILMLLHKEIPESTIKMFLERIGEDVNSQNMLIKGGEYASQNTDIVRAIANKARKILPDQSVAKFPSPAINVGDILFTSEITRDELMKLNLDRIPPVQQIRARKF